MITNILLLLLLTNTEGCRLPGNRTVLQRTPPAGNSSINLVNNNEHNVSVMAIDFNRNADTLYDPYIKSGAW